MWSAWMAAMVQRLPMFARAGCPWWLGDGPAAGPVLEPEGGQAGEVDHAGSGEDVGEDAGLASAAGFAPAPRPPGEVADLAFHDGPVGAVGLLPVRVALAGFSVLQRRLLRVDADHPPGSCCGARRAQRAASAQIAEPGLPATALRADRHGVPSRAGDR